MKNKKSKCKICGNNLFEKPLLKFNNMPSIAQNLPDLESLKKDKGVDLNVYQCSGCGLVQLDIESVSYYKEVIRASGFSEEMKTFRKNQFHDFVEKYNLKNKKIIEIGCGKGEYLSIMQNQGVLVYGIEENSDSVNHCIKNNLNVSQGFIDSENYKVNDSLFDSFFIISFLEHIPDINSFLRGIYNNLSEDAVGLVEVPNFDMILEKKLFSEFMRDHLFYFTRETLRTAMELNGFEMIESNVVWHNYILSAVVKKRKRLDISCFYNYQKKIVSELNEYIKKFENKKIAVWGAGHQALAILSLADLKDRIKYVIDSAPFKQGKYTPATHIPIIGPEKIIENKIEAIIVIAASYSDEIARIIKEKYKDKINLAIFRDYGLEII